MSGGLEPLRLCVNGNLGSGKSTVAKTLAERMGLEYFATGRIQRALAEQLGITILELNQRAETDKTIDTQLDAQFEPIAAQHARIVFDSRLAWNFVPGAVKARLLCHPATSAARIYGDTDSSRGVEAFASLEAARASIGDRRASERKRFLDLYQVDIEDLGNYDLVLQTDLVSPDQVVEAVERWLVGPREVGALMLNPRLTFPLVDAEEDASPPMEVVQVRDCFFAVRGVARLKQAVLAGESWIEARRAQEDEGTVRARFDAAYLERWQEEHGFEFPLPPGI